MSTLRYSVTASPVGELTIAAGGAGVCFMSFGPVRAGVLRGFELQEVKRDATIQRAIEQLRAYFRGELRAFDIPLDMVLARPFTQKISKLLLEVPFGETVSYGELAREAGSSARAVGGAVGANLLPVVVPCHRVIAADGTLGGFSGGLDTKRKLLALEGHEPFQGGWAPRRRTAPV